MLAVALISIPVFAAPVSAISGRGGYEIAVTDVLIGLSALVFLVAVFSVWNWSLRRGVRRAATALHESEERYRTLVEMSPEAIFVQCDERLVFANQAAINLVGANSLAEIVGRKPIEFVHPDSLDSILARRAETLNGGQPQLFQEHRYVRFDGAEVNVETASGRFQWYGRPALVVVVRDITKHKQAEAALEESEERFRKVIEQSPDAIVIHCDDEIAYVNNSAVAMFGARDRDELIGRPSMVLIHPDHKQDILAFRKALQDGRLEQVYPDIRFVRIDGGEFRGAASGTFITWTGRPAFQIGIRDITREHQAQQALRDSEERFRAVVDNAPLAISLKDLKGRFRMVNRRFEEWYGLSNDKIVGLTAEDFFPERLFASFKAQEREVWETMEIVESELLLPFADGAEHRIVLTRFPVLDGDGKTIGIGAFNTDVTSQRNVEAQLHQVQKIEAVGRLTGGVAHEFNNLLLVILGNVELLEEKLLADESLQRLATTAKKSALRGAELTQRMLAFSRNQSLEVTRVELDDLINGMGEMLGRTLGETISIDIEIPDDVWDVAADKGQTEGALLNLAINARDAMRGGGTISIRARNLSLDGKEAVRVNVAPGDYVALSFQDTGSGMTEHVREHAFDPFFTTKEIGSGTGLGLSMVYGSVTQSGGAVAIASTPGEGTTVTIHLPRTDSAMIAGPDNVVSEDETPPGSGDILVVEDDAEVRALVVRLLDGLGYGVEEAENGAAALKRIEETDKFDLLFTDIVMPGGISGLELWRRAQNLRDGLKVVFTSGYSDDVIARSDSMGENFPLVRKPYVRSELARVIRNTLSGR